MINKKTLLLLKANINKILANYNRNSNNLQKFFMPNL